MASASPRKKAEASEGKNLPCPFVQQKVSCPHTQPGGSAPSSEEQQGSNEIMTFGVCMTRQIIYLSLQLSSPAGCKELLCQAARLRLTGLRRGRGHSLDIPRLVKWACRVATHTQECYLWCRPWRLICAVLLLHLALPGRAPGLTYHWQGHMSCQLSGGLQVMGWGGKMRANSFPFHNPTPTPIPRLPRAPGGNYIMGWTPWRPGVTHPFLPVHPLVTGTEIGFHRPQQVS